MIKRKIQKECKKSSYRRIVTPTSFARELVDAVSNDPGSKVKAMLFYIDDIEVEYVSIISEAKVTVLKLTRKGQK